MKTTLNLNDQLVAEARERAVLERTSLTRLIEEGLTLRLRLGSESASVRDAEAAALPIYKGRSGLASGIDPSSNAALLDAADA